MKCYHNCIQDVGSVISKTVTLLYIEHVLEFHESINWMNRIVLFI